jgi:hypothetical protein
MVFARPKNHYFVITQKKNYLEYYLLVADHSKLTKVSLKVIFGNNSVFLQVITGGSCSSGLLCAAANPGQPKFYSNQILIPPVIVSKLK